MRRFFTLDLDEIDELRRNIRRETLQEVAAMLLAESRKEPAPWSYQYGVRRAAELVLDLNKKES